MDNNKKQLKEGDELTVRSTLIDAVTFACVPHKQNPAPIIKMGGAILKPKKGKVWLSQVSVGDTVLSSSLLGMKIPSNLLLYSYSSQMITPVTKIDYHVLVSNK